MQNKPSNDQHKNIYYRLRRSDPHERLSARLRHFSFGAAVFFVVAAAGIVTHSLYNIQIKQGATFRQYAAQQQLLDSTIQATRGEIYDASGITLASTSVVWTIWADPSYSTALFTSQTVEETGEAVKTVDETTLADVSRQLTLRLLSGDGESLDSVDTSSAEYQTQYQTVHDALAKNGSSYQVLATKVNNAVKLSIEKYISEYNKNHAKAKTLEDGTAIKKGRISVSSSKSFQRDYPYGAFAASVLGFCNGDGEGFYGLEKSYNDTLAGVNGRTITLRNAYGNAIADANATTYAAKDGSNLVLSLDVNVQEVVERYLNEAIYANTVENRGAAIVMNVKTGAILAMASKPDFDPNAPLDFSENLAYLNEQVNAEPEIYTIYKKDANGNYLRDEQGKKIPEEEPDYTGTYRDIQWKNKTITELYYPGSVFKVITAAMGVDSGKATYYTTFNCSGAYGVAKETYHCAGKKAHGVQNLAEALRNSCNIYFIQLGQRLGSSVFYDYFDAFGFTERTGMLDDPNNAHTDYSSILAAPVVGNIISEIAPYLGIATDGIDRSQNTVKVPNLVGKEWSNAQVSLNTKGLKHQLVESESDQTAAVVTYQYPHAGATVASGTTIYLYTDTYSGSHTEVPDVSGKSADFARQMLTAAGLNCQVAGEGTGTVQSQSEAAGASVQKGTVVTITCG